MRVLVTAAMLGLVLSGCNQKSQLESMKEDPAGRLVYPGAQPKGQAFSDGHIPVGDPLPPSVTRTYSIDPSQATTATKILAWYEQNVARYGYKGDGAPVASTGPLSVLGQTFKKGCMNLGVWVSLTGSPYTYYGGPGSGTPPPGTPLEGQGVAPAGWYDASGRPLTGSLPSALEDGVSDVSVGMSRGC